MKIFLIMFLLFALVPIASADLSKVNQGVDKYFKIMDNRNGNGLDDVQEKVETLYAEYDKHPSLDKLQIAAGIDLSACMFLLNLNPKYGALTINHYPNWESKATTTRIATRLRNHIKDDEEIGKVIVLWADSVRTKMHLHYLSQH